MIRNFLKYKTINNAVHFSRRRQNMQIVCSLSVLSPSHYPGPEKRHIPHKVVDSGNGVFRIEFTTVEVGSYVIDVNVSGLSVPNSPLIAKAACPVRLEAGCT